MIKKIIYVFLFIMITISGGWLGFNAYNLIALNKEKGTSSLDLKLSGNSSVEVAINGEYTDEGGVAYYNGKEYPLKPEGNVNFSIPGTYLVKYTADIDSDLNYSVYRTVKVVDKKAPVLVLKGKQEMSLYVGEKYEDPGFTVTDDSGIDLTSRVVVTGEVNSKKVGTYEIVYSVKDDSENETKITRKVVIKNRPVVTNIVATKVTAKEKGDVAEKKVDLKATSNSTISMSYTSNGIHLEGYVKNGSGKYSIKVCKSSDCTTTTMKTKDKYYYSGDIKLSSLANGTYKVKVVDKKEMDLVNKLDYGERLNRAKIGDKLVTFSYDKDVMTFKVEDHKYEYDIVIDPGHGGSDPGATNKKMEEKVLNLEQSLYEKERYEEHGLKVKIIRTSNSNYGEMMGPKNEANVRRRAYTMGYYGAVSHFVYSNHHNSINNNYYSGWEVIMPTRLGSSASEFKAAIKVANGWKEAYPVGEEHLRIYTRPYPTGALKDKSSGQVYNNIRNYYAILRLTSELYNVNTILYEGAYLSNSDDFDWYYTQGNWKKMSEIKIKTYVEALGKDYIAPKE